MDQLEVREHWDSWAQTYGTELRATTKCETIKLLEIEAFSRWIERLMGNGAGSLVLEVGCGNGINGFGLAERNPRLNYVGLDYSDAMVANATEIADRHAADSGRETPRMAFTVGDARELSSPLDLDRSGPHFAGADVEGLLPSRAVDVAITDRMLINLGSAEEQLEVMRAVSGLVRQGGYFLMLENSVQTHTTLNEVRVSLGLDVRPAAEFNVFIDEDSVIQPFTEVMELVAVDDFSALHDLLLYAVQPAIGDGNVEYDTPLLRTLTQALATLGEIDGDAKPYGQNRLWVWQKN